MSGAAGAGPGGVRIAAIRVDGFGIHRGLELAGLAPGVQVIAGPNEAGKSTLLSFLRWMLFAPWAGRGVNPPLPPLRGGEAGGSLELVAGGGTWRLAKHVAGSRRTFRLEGPDGREGDAADLAALLGGTSLDLFQQVFFFDLAEMAEIGRLAGESLEGRLLAAGLTGAGRGARELDRELEAEARKLAAPRGDCLLRELLERRARVAERLGELRRAAREAASVEEERRLAGEIEELRAERERLAARRSFLAAVDEIAELTARAAALREEREGLHLDPELEALAPEAEALAGELAAAREAAGEAGRLRARREELARRLADGLGELGPGWTAERLSALAPVAELRERARALDRQRREARDALREARGAAEVVRQREVAVGPPESADPGRTLLGLAAIALVIAAGLFLAGDDPLPGGLALLVALLLAGQGVRATRRRREESRRERERLARERGAAEERARQAEREVAAADAAWEAFLAEAGLPPADGAEAVLAFLDRARELASLRRELEGVERELADRRGRVARWIARAEELLGRAGEPAPGDPGDAVADPAARLPLLAAALEQLRGRIAAAREARARAGRIDARLAEIEERRARVLAGRDPAAVEEALAAGDADARAAAVAETERRLGELDREIGERQRRLGALEGERRRLAGDDSLPALEQEQRSIEAALAAAVERWQRLALGRALAAAALRRFRERHQPEVLRRASAWLAAMTGGRHVAVRVRGEGEGLEIAGPAGETLGPDQLSRGTVEQLWLALRLALAVHVAGAGAAPPLVLDDVLVDFDPARRAAAARILAGVGRELQVLVLTCHPDLADLLAREAGAAVTELPPT